jgi:hypothetical protein
MSKKSMKAEPTDTESQNMRYMTPRKIGNSEEAIEDHLVYTLRDAPPPAALLRAR